MAARTQEEIARNEEGAGADARNGDANECQIPLRSGPWGRNAAGVAAGAQTGRARSGCCGGGA